MRIRRTWGVLLSFGLATLSCACEGDVLPTRAEEQLRIAESLSRTLARSLETLPGVADARVHLALPTTPDFAAEPADAPSASVLLHARGDRADIDVHAVQTLVAGAVPRLSQSAVQVVVAALPAARGAPPPRLTHVGPFLVAESSEPALRALLASLLVLQLLLAALLFFVIARRRRLQPAAPGGRPSA